jgi:tryptophan synthase beta chain
MAPIVCHLYDLKLIEAVALRQNPCFEAAVSFARAEGHIPAPEAGHAIRCAMDEALKCKESGQSKVIVFNNSGHGHFDLGSYEKYFAGKLEDADLSEAELKKALADLPKVG